MCLHLFFFRMPTHCADAMQFVPEEQVALSAVEPTLMGIAVMLCRSAATPQPLRLISHKNGAGFFYFAEHGIPACKTLWL